MACLKSKAHSGEHNASAIGSGCGDGVPFRDLGEKGVVISTIKSSKYIFLIGRGMVEWCCEMHVPWVSTSLCLCPRSNAEHTESNKGNTREHAVINNEELR